MLEQLNILYSTNMRSEKYKDLGLPLVIFAQVFPRISNEQKYII
jgi:hypothetical protein